MPNPLWQQDSIPGTRANALAPSPTWADAYEYNKPVVQQYLADTGDRLQDPKWWNDAAHQYVNAMLMGTTAPGMRMPSGLIDVGKTAAHVNPSRGDLARMMEAAPEHTLRVLREGPNVAVWPAYDATHAEMAAPLGFTKDAASQYYRGRVGEPDKDFSNRLGRFSFMAVEN